MIAISIANSVGSRRSSAPVVVVPVATAATGVGETSFTANWNAFAGANYYLLDVSLNSSFSSFVGSYQNYVTIGTSQLVSGLTPNTTYYYRLRAVTGVDSDAAAFFSRVYTAGGVLSYTEVTATETLVYDMKTAGLWTAMKAVYPMVGASAAACAQNLKSSSFTGTFTSGWTFASTGATPNGTSAYMDTGLNGRLILGNQRSFGFYNNTNTNGIVHIGSINNSDGGQDYIGLGTFQIYRINSQGDNIGQSNTSKGLWIARSNSTSADLFLNGSILKSFSATVSNTVNAYYYLACAPLNNNFGDTQYAFAFICDSFTNTQASNFYTCVQTFQTTLSRNV